MKNDTDKLEIISEKPVEYVQMDIVISEEMKNKLLEIARQNILQDEDALLNWVIAQSLKYGINIDQKKNK